MYLPRMMPSTSVRPIFTKGRSRLRTYSRASAAFLILGASIRRTLTGRGKGARRMRAPEGLVGLVLTFALGERELLLRREDELVASDQQEVGHHYGIIDGNADDGDPEDRVGELEVERHRRDHHADHRAGD